MKKRTSKKSILLRSFMALPILAMLLVGFSQTKTVVHEKATQEMVDTYNSLATKYNGIPVQHRAIPPHDLRTLEHIFSKMTHEQKDTAQPFPECPPQVGATKYQISEYNALAKKYYELPLGVSGFSEEEIKRINYIYGIMSAKQKADAEPFPFPDFAKPRPTSSQIKTDIEKNAQDGASRELMAEYNKLAKHYNNMPRNRMRIKGKEVERLEYIYGIMSEKQKADAEPFPDFPPMPEPPAPPPAPSQIEPGEEEVAPSATDSPVPKDLEKNMEVAMEGHETAMKKQEREMEKQEIAMKEQETHLKKQEIAMEAHRSEREKHNIEPPMPPPPPAPKSPLDHAVEMAKLGAVFYFKNKKITSDEAIEILKRNDDLSMDIKRTNNQTPVVKIDTHF